VIVLLPKKKYQLFAQLDHIGALGVISIKAGSEIAVLSKMALEATI